MMLLNVKNRHGETRDIPLRFHRASQRFDPDEAASTPTPDKGKLKSALAALWKKTDIAADEGDQ